MATIRFFLKPKDGKFYISAMLSHASAEKPRSIGFSLNNRRFWDDKKQRAKGCPESVDINAKISRWESVFDGYKGQVKRGEVDFDFDKVTGLLTGSAKVKAKTSVRSMTLAAAAWKVYDVKFATMAPGTAKQYKTLAEDLEEYDTFTKTKHVITEIDKNFYQQFGLWLIDRKDNINNTVNRKISRIITVLDWAFEAKLLADQYYKIKFSFKGNESDAHPPLWPEEIEKLYKAPASTPFQRMILNAFIFACETGLRISDVYQLHNRHIKMQRDKDGQFKYIDFTQEKTTSSNRIPLNNRALEILATTPKTGLVFDLPEEHYVNRFLKDAASHDDVKLTRQIEFVYNKGNRTIKEFRRLCDEISFHCGRSSYITNSLASGVNPVFVKDNAGHSSLKVTMSYSTQEEMNRMKETLKIQNAKSPS